MSNIKEAIEDVKKQYSIRELYIKKNHPDLYEYINNIDAPLDNKGNEMQFKQKVYHIINNDITFQLGKCPICNKRVRFRDGKYAATYCSNQCIGKSKEVIALRSIALRSEKTRNKYKTTCLEKYGCEHQSQCKEIKQKLSKAHQSDETKSKFKQTCLTRYGVESPAQNKNIKKKMIYAQQSGKVKSKRIKTNIAKYGVPYSVQSNKIKNKLLLAQNAENTKNKKENTVTSKYGVFNISQCDIIKKKISESHLTEYTKNKTKSTCLEKYGAEHAAQNEEIRKKISITNSSQKVLNKTKSTCLERYGVEHVLQCQEILEKANNTKRKRNTFNTSSIEESIACMLSENNIRYIRQYTSKQYPFNCDFYLVDYQLYIEINASWTHGKFPYESNNIQCRTQLDIWIEKSKTHKYYKAAIETWTIRDVKNGA